MVVLKLPSCLSLFNSARVSLLNCFWGKTTEKKEMRTRAVNINHHEEKKNAPKRIRRGGEGEERGGEERDFCFVVGFARE